METRARSLLIGIFVLTAIVASFGFVYWLNSAGHFGERANYLIRFDGPVSGLQIGATVQFNGIRVGEVTLLRLDPDDPKKVVATIAVARSTPVRADTHVGVDFQGLMGTPAISLSGGAAAFPRPISPNGEPPLLVADATAGQDLSQAARTALQHVDKVLTDNSGSLKETIDNLKIFSGALARNSDRVDSIIAALERLAGGGAAKPKALYELSAAIPSMPRPMPRGLIAVAEPTAVIALQTQHMLIRSPDGALSQLDNAEWSDTLPKLVQAKLVQAFEDAGHLEVEPQTEGSLTKWQLLINLRNFTIVDGEPQRADVEFTAKLVGSDGHVVAARLFHATAPFAGTDIATIVKAFDKAFTTTALELLTWIAEVS